MNNILLGLNSKLKKDILSKISWLANIYDKVPNAPSLPYIRFDNYKFDNNIIIGNNAISITIDLFIISYYIEELFKSYDILYAYFQQLINYQLQDSKNDNYKIISFNVQKVDYDNYDDKSQCILTVSFTLFKI